VQLISVWEDGHASHSPLLDDKHIVGLGQRALYGDEDRHATGYAPSPKAVKKRRGEKK
jgi:hypothetical protein